MPYVFGELKGLGIRICAECGDVSLEDEMHWHEEKETKVAEPTFYEEDGNEIIEAVTYMMNHKAIPRMDISLGDEKKAKVYWAGTILRIDIEGLKQ